MKFGMYTSAGYKTCAGLPGIMTHEETDIKQFIEQFKIDFLKVDNCFNDGKPIFWRYKRVADAINK